MKTRPLLLALTLTAALFAVGSAHATITVLNYWHMGENDPGAVSGGYCTNTIDAVGGKTLTNTPVGGVYPSYTNGVSASAAAETGSALALSLTNGQYGTAALATSAADNFGIECWVNPGTPISGGHVLALNGVRSTGWGLYVGGASFEILYGGKAFFDSVPAPPNVWTHLALVRNNGTATFYTNGVPAGTNFTTAPITPSGSFTVGGNAQFAEFFTGLIDEVRVFTFAVGAFSTNDLLLNSTNVLVSNAGDNGAGSLRAAIANAPNGARVTFATNLSGQTILLTGGEIDLNNNITIDASALAGGIQINGNASSRIFGIFGAAVLNALTITNGRSVFGGAIDSYGNVIINKCTFAGNHAISYSDGGGAIDMEGGTVIVNESTFTGNQVEATGPSDGGGAIVNEVGLLVVNGSTFSGNHADTSYGGGIQNYGTLDMTNSIVCGNTAASGQNISGSYSGGNNLSDANALLAPLGNYGGPTQTMPPLPGSPAINAGAPTALTTDQRGYPRTVGSAPDIGAVELQTPFLVVTANSDDANSGTLRNIIASADTGSAITFASPLSGQTILLTGGQIVLSTNVTIDASALKGGIVINGNGTSGVFLINPGATVVLTALTITNGSSGSGGGVDNNAGTVTLNECILAGNHADNSPGGGGGISDYNNSVTTLNACTLYNNSATNGGYGGGGIFNFSGTLNVNQCTLYGNRADNSVGGGGILNDNATLNVNQSTLYGNNADNSAYGGGGIFSYGPNMTVTNSIIAGNRASNGGDIYDQGSVTYVGTNLVQNVYYNSAIVIGTYINAAPQLAPLANYGGPTPTMPPLPGSPAIDAGAATTLTTDQRGYPRVVGPAVDIGAVEFQASPVVTTADVIAGSLRYAITYVTNNATITFDPSLSGKTIIVTNGQMVLTQNVTIDGSALPNAVAINGNHASRLFTVNGGVSAVLNTLILTNGYATTGSAGGAVVNSGTLTVNNCTLTGNTSTVNNSGGGAVHNSGTLTVNNSTFAGNQSGYVGGAIGNTATIVMNESTIVSNSAASGGGGGIYNNAGTLDLTNSIVAGNSPSAGDIANASSTFNQVSNVYNIANPQVAPLGNYGGPTPTMTPLPGSPAIDRGISTALTTDQRGFPRPVGLAPDIGAVEVQSPAASPPVLGNITQFGGGGGTSGFQFTFTNAPDADFTVLTATNVALPVANWTVLGEVMQPAPGQYQFTDPHGTTNAIRFYRVRSP